MKQALIIFSIMLLFSPLFGQSEKPQTIIIPTGSLGEISEVRKKMLEKTLESKLDDYFSIVPKELFEEAREQAFEEIDFDECSEERCIAIIQEILQVPNAFQLIIMAEEGDTQISLTWNDMEKRRVGEYFCEGCKTKELRNMVEELVVSLVENIVGSEKVVQQPVVSVERSQVGVMYRRRGPDGELEWVRNGNKLTDSKYIGDIEYGLPNGKGIITFPNGEKYRGKLMDGKPHGQGTLTWKDGQKFVANWMEGLPNGKSSVIFPDGIEHIGIWNEGVLVGDGNFSYPPKFNENKIASICSDCMIDNLINTIVLLINDVDKGPLTITSKPSDAPVYIDGKLAGVTPLRTVMTLGEHNMEIENPSSFYLPKKRKFKLIFKKNSFFEEELTQVGVISIKNLRSGDNVTINNKNLGSHKLGRPLILSKVPGNYTINLSREYFVPETRRYKLKPGKEITVDLNSLIPFGEIKISNLLPKDKILIDEKPVPIKTLKSSGISYNDRILLLKIKKGPHTVLLKRKGFINKSILLQVENGKKYIVNMDEMVPMAEIIFSNLQSGDNVKVGNKPISVKKANKVLQVRKGSHRVNISRNGFVDKTLNLMVEDGGLYLVDMNDLVPLGAIVFSNLKTKDEVKIDGKIVGKKRERSSGAVYEGNKLVIRLKKGLHTVSLKRKGFKDRYLKFEIEDNKRYKVDMDKFEPIKGILNMKINVDAQLEIRWLDSVRTSIKKYISNDVQFSLPTGRYEYIAKNKYYEEKRGEFIIKADQETFVMIEMIPFPSILRLTVDSTSRINESWPSIMGLIQVEEDDFGIYIDGNLKTHNHEFKKTELNFESGNYDLGVKHRSKKYEDHNESIRLLPGRTKNLEVKLKPTEEFLVHSQWQSKMDKLILATAGSFLISYMSYSAYTEASAKKNEYEAKINDASNPEMQDTYYEKTNGEIDKMKTSAANALLFSLVGLGFGGWTYWAWTEQPERSDPINFSINYFQDNQLKIALGFDF